MARFRIYGITDWEKDEHMMEGDMSHMPEHDVLRLYADEYEKKVENDDWPNIPFECEAKDEDEALEKYQSEVCEYDYIIPTGADIERIDDEGEEVQG